MLSLIGAVLGFGTSFLPRVLDFFQKKRDQAHELEMVKAQTDAQIKLEGARLLAINVDADIRETEALHSEQTKITLKASPWMVNLNASVRPVLTYLFFLEFVSLTWLLAFGMIDDGLYMTVWNNEIQAIWASVVCFWFGSRTYNRIHGHT